MVASCNTMMVSWCPVEVDALSARLVHMKGGSIFSIFETTFQRYLGSSEPLKACSLICCLLGEYLIIIQNVSFSQTRFIQSFYGLPFSFTSRPDLDIGCTSSCLAHKCHVVVSFLSLTHFPVALVLFCLTLLDFNRSICSLLCIYICLVLCSSMLSGCLYDNCLFGSLKF